MFYVTGTLLKIWCLRGLKISTQAHKRHYLQLLMRRLQQSCYIILGIQL